MTLRIPTLLCAVVMLLPAETKVVVDDDQVRVLLVTEEIGGKSPLHQHDRNRVMIYLDPGEMRIAYEDGSAKDLRWKAGDVRWDPAGGKHTSANTGKTTV